MLAESYGQPYGLTTRGVSPHGQPYGLTTGGGRRTGRPHQYRRQKRQTKGSNDRTSVLGRIADICTLQRHETTSTPHPSPPHTPLSVRKCKVFSHHAIACHQRHRLGRNYPTITWLKSSSSTNTIAVGTALNEPPPAQIPACGITGGVLAKGRFLEGSAISLKVPIHPPLPSKKLTPDYPV